MTDGLGNHDPLPRWIMREITWLERHQSPCRELAEVVNAAPNQGNRRIGVRAEFSTRDSRLQRPWAG